MTRIVLDPEELNRFAAFSADAADDYSARAARVRSLEVPPMPPEVASIVQNELLRVSSTLEGLAANLYAEALVLRARAAALDPALRRYLTARLAAQPG